MCWVNNWSKFFQRTRSDRSIAWNGVPSKTHIQKQKGEYGVVLFPYNNFQLRRTKSSIPKRYSILSCIWSSFLEVVSYEGTLSAKRRAGVPPRWLQVWLSCYLKFISAAQMKILWKIIDSEKGLEESHESFYDWV